MSHAFVDTTGIIFKPHICTTFGGTYTRPSFSWHAITWVSIVKSLKTIHTDQSYKMMCQRLVNKHGHNSMIAFESVSKSTFLVKCNRIAVGGELPPTLGRRCKSLRVWELADFEKNGIWWNAIFGAFCAIFCACGVRGQTWLEVPVLFLFLSIFR